MELPETYQPSEQIREGLGAQEAAKSPWPGGPGLCHDPELPSSHSKNSGCSADLGRGQPASCLVCLEHEVQLALVEMVLWATLIQCMQP